MLSIRHFSKAYAGGKNAKKAVDDLSLEIAAGDIYGFIGHNGAGKTTTLRAVAGVLDFTEGDILLDGVSVRKDPVACKKAIAYIPDNPDLYEHLTGMQYLGFIADLFEVSGSQRRREIERYAVRFEIDDRLGELIGSYSHGMKQKLALCSALLHHPKLYLLDEPFVGLDPKATHTCKEIMAEECARGCAFFFSTHVLEVAERLCNRIAIIKDGRLAASGETGAVIGDGSLEDLFMELIDEHA